MKNIKNLTVKVTYWVELRDFSMPDGVYRHIVNRYEADRNIDDMPGDLLEASEWLNRNINERDCCERDFAIEEVEAENEEGGA